MTKIFVGIDSSTTCCGWAFISEDGALVDSGKILTNPKDSYLDKCSFIVSELFKVLDAQKECIISIGIETPNSFRNGTITRMLCGLYGIIRLEIYKRYELEAEEVGTSHAKKNFTGDGSADKYKTIKFANKKFKLKLKFHKTNKNVSDDDIADAISIAYSVFRDSKKVL